MPRSTAWFRYQEEQMIGTRVFVHFDGQNAWSQLVLFDLMAKGILPGHAIPRQYHVRRCQVQSNGSVDLLVTNGGGPVNVLMLSEYIKKYWPAKNTSISVGEFGTEKIPPDEAYS